MFEDSLVESTHRIHAQNRWTFAVSIALQAALAAAIIVLPLLHPETLQRLALSPPVLVAPPPPLPPPPPRVVTRTDTSSSAPSAAAPQTFVRAVIHSAADFIMRPQQGQEVPPGMLTNLSMVAAGDPAGIGTTLGPATGHPSISVAAPVKPLKLSSGVSAGLLLAPIQPVYPIIAKSSHTEGTVIIHAIISKTGRIESANVVSGSQLLQGAAIDAVRAARYRPFLLNGEPTEVDTTITINFRLSSS